MQSALDELTQLLSEEGVVSAYELHSSGLVQALLSLLSTSPWDEGLRSNKTSKLQKQRVRLFKNCFKAKDGENGSINAGMILVHKLIAVLESIEKLPIYLYDTPGSGYGLQVSCVFIFLDRSFFNALKKLAFSNNSYYCFRF